MIYELKKKLEWVELFFQNLYHSLLSVLKVIMLSKFNNSLNNDGLGDCVVLGNGPSLKSSLERNRQFFLDKELFCVNMFPSTNEYLDLKPGNLVWLDTAFYICPTKEEMIQRRPDVHQVISDVIEKTTWPMNLFLPRMSERADYLKDISRLNNYVKIQYYNYTIVQGFEFVEDYFFKRNLGMPACENILGAAIFLALNRNFKKIYLIGADHSWMRDVSVGDNNEILLNHKHFYSEDSNRILVVKNPTSNRAVNMLSFCRSLYKAFHVYYVLSRYAKRVDAQIFNATEGSYIDAFDRVKI